MYMITHYICFPIYCQALSDKYNMPKLSLYRENKQNDYRFLDRNISEQLTVGGTDLYIHKYLGPTDQGPSIDYTQPQYNKLDPTNIQDLLFLENRDRTYDPNIYRLRGHYNVQNLDFDLSQFGLFLNNDIIFITVHYNDMIEIVGRKLMVGDVIELPHLLDYNPLKETIPVALKRFMQITDANYASEGFSQTWFPHLWRIKCEPLVDSQEFSQILQQPINQDTYLGLWDSTKTYPAGYVITYGDKNYKAKIDVPVGIAPPNETYWELDTADNLRDILGTYNKNIAVNDAVINEAKRIVPKSGYDTSELYVVPTYGVWEENGVLSKKINQPAPPIDIVVSSSGIPGSVTMIRNPKYKKASPAIKISKAAMQSIWDMTVDSDPSDILDKFVQASLQVIEKAPERLSTGSGQVSGTNILTLQSLGQITGPYGTADNTYATADQDPTQPGFSGTISQQMDFRADCDPRFQYISRYTPRSFSYTNGYLTGDGTAPNGLPTGTGIAFPNNPQVGDYFLRIDYLPNVLFRWDGTIWVRMSTNVRTETGFTEQDKSLLSGFINDTGVIYSNAEQQLIPEAQPLSTILTIAPDPLPPVE
jgi:hypothetical protein